jgi:predicted N-formylglutamate amidohydrolase
LSAASGGRNRSRRAAQAPAILLSCEHGGNRIPAGFRALFHGRHAQLASHRGYDIGALACARALGAAWRAPLIHAETSRLLVDLNRSPGHPALFPPFIRTLPEPRRALILARHYFPHRERIERWIAERVRRGRTVVHIAVHSFTPVLDGRARSADIGLLYDPARPLERLICGRWQAALRRESGLRVRRNYPYRGVSDGLTRHLRQRFPPHAYAGIELEINQGTLAKRRAAVIAALGATRDELYP